MSKLQSPATQQQLDALAGTSWHSVLLHGQPGVAFADAARQLAHGTVLRVVPVLRTKASTVESIGVEAIRELQNDVKTRQERTVIIERAHEMTVQAQNTFLKLLEEPNDSTHFILVSTQPDTLLPTIRSRLQRVHVRPLSQAASETILNDYAISDETLRRQLLFLASGRAEELERLATDESYRKQRVMVVKRARDLLAATMYQRIILLGQWKLSRSDALALVEVMIQLLQRTPKQPQLEVMRRLDAAHEAITANGNVRLQLTAAMVQ